MALTLLRPNGAETSLNAVTATSDTKGTAFCIPPMPKKPGEGRLITWEYHFSGSPSAVQMQLQGAFNDVDAEYAVLDEAVDVNGSMRSLIVNVKFVRIRQITRTGGTSVTAQLMIA